MTHRAAAFDYLIVTAANPDQAEAYEAQLEKRQALGLLSGAHQVLVLSDPGGVRIGSGGSTLYCLMEVLRRERPEAPSKEWEPLEWRETLKGLRILIIHAGGDAKRLPAYGPCGKIFIPVPGESDAAVPLTLFDRQVETYLALPPGPEGAGQVVITSGDVLLFFDPEAVRFNAPGIIGLGCRADPEEASRHGVFCLDRDAAVRLFLQKPTVEEQAAQNALDRYDRAVLDIGVMHFDAQVAALLLETFGTQVGPEGALTWTGEMGDAIEAFGLDFYREICCALGGQTTAPEHVEWAKGSGSGWDEALLQNVYHALHEIPFSAQVLPRCGFHHFGTSHQIIHSGLEMISRDRGQARLRSCLEINNAMEGEGRVVGTNAWVEGCRIASELKLEGHNIVVGLDVDRLLTLTRRSGIGMLEGKSRKGQKIHFVLCFGVADLFKDRVNEGALFCDLSVLDWLEVVGLPPEEVWASDLPEGERTVWDARLFPGVTDPSKYRDFLWMFAPGEASLEQREAFRKADRYSLAEIADLADPKAFHDRRDRLRCEEILQSLRRMFHTESGFSAEDLATCLGRLPPKHRTRWVSRILDEAHWHHGGDTDSGPGASFALSRILHTLGSVLEQLTTAPDERMGALFPGLKAALKEPRKHWLSELGLATDSAAPEWAAKAKALSFDLMGAQILLSGTEQLAPPSNALRSDEIVWGRAPARLDLGGGWTDTPPYSLEHGGCVINAAVDLNGQPPIHVYGRVIEEKVIRLTSIDLGTRMEIATLTDLMDFGSATSEFALAKAALALSGFSSDGDAWGKSLSLEEMLGRFGGGLELTTLATIPKGSGLGTSSIVGAVILAVLMRILGRNLSRRELFHGVLRMEQALTTGGGWQDQIGGVVDGVKVASTEPGLVPDARIHYVPPDVLDPSTNGGATLLYYTGITRLAKDILHQVVGRYLDRNRRSMETLKRIHQLPPHVADAMARKDLSGFGRLIDTAWRLNKALDPDSSNEAVEALLERIRPHVHGAKLLGAGGGGFLLLVCRSPEEAGKVRQMLTREPPNLRARFFDFEVSREGLVVTVS